MALRKRSTSPWRTPSSPVLEAVAAADGSLAADGDDVGVGRATLRWGVAATHEHLSAGLGSAGSDEREQLAGAGVVANAETIGWADGDGTVAGWDYVRSPVVRST